MVSCIISRLRFRPSNHLNFLMNLAGAEANRFGQGNSQFHTQSRYLSAVDVKSKSFPCIRFKNTFVYVNEPTGDPHEPGEYPGKGFSKTES